jgi:hypothetical protein
LTLMLAAFHCWHLQLIPLECHCFMTKLARNQPRARIPVAAVFSDIMRSHKIVCSNNFGSQPEADRSFSPRRTTRFRRKNASFFVVYCERAQSTASCRIQSRHQFLVYNTHTCRKSKQLNMYAAHTVDGVSWLGKLKS